MAAHVLTILKEIADRGTPLDQIQAALSCAPGMDHLDMDDFHALSVAKDAEEARQIAVALVPKYTTVWHYLGRPSDTEAWSKTWLNMDQQARDFYWKMRAVSCLPLKE